MTDVVGKCEHKHIKDRQTHTHTHTHTHTQRANNRPKNVIARKELKEPRAVILRRGLSLLSSLSFIGPLSHTNINITGLHTRFIHKCKENKSSYCAMVNTSVAGG